MQNTPPWGKDFGTWCSGVLVTFSPAHSQSSSKNGTERSETTFANACVLQPGCPAPRDACHEHMPEHPNLTLSLLARQHRTFGLILFPQVLPNTPRQKFLSASCVLHQPAKSSCLGSDKFHCFGKSRLWICLCCRETESWPEHLPGNGAVCCPGSWLALLAPG